jgi:hypothetical protein
MKNLNQKKKIVLINWLLVFAVLSIALIVNSCKKDANSNEQNKLADSTLNEARQWYENTYSLNSSPDKQIINGIGKKRDWSKILRPNWDKAEAFVSKGLNFIELPATKRGDMAFTTKDLPPGQFDFKNANSATSLLLIKQNGEYAIYAMTILADETYLKGNRSKLKNNTYRNRDQDFTGRVFYHTMDGTFINGWRYVNGKVTNALYHQKESISQGSQSIQSVGGSKTNMLQDCMATVVVTVYSICDYPANDVNLEHPSNCSYSNTVDIFYDGDCGNVDTPPSGGGSAPQNPCTPSGSGGGGQYEDAVSNDKKVQVYQPNPTPPIDPTGPIYPPQQPIPCPTTPPPLKADTIVLLPAGCNKEVVKKLLSKNLSGKISNLIQSVFNSSDKVNLKFVESTQTSGKPALSTEIKNTTINGQRNFTFEIRLNPNLIPSDASQEFKAAIIIHEILHGYLQYENQNYNNQLKQHYVIANEYAEGVADILNQMFGTNPEQGYSLAFSGLGDYKTKDPQGFTQLLASKGLTSSQQSGNYEFQRGGLYGTPCPNN